MERDHGGHGVATLWQRSKFKLRTRLDIYFDQEVEFDTRQEPSCETGNVALVVVLERVDCPGKGIIVSNHHLYWKPKAKDERIRQCWVLQSKLKQLLPKYPNWPMFLCGDWNTLPSDELYDKLVTGKSLLGEEVPWKRLVDAKNGQGSYASFTTSVGSKERWWGACVDYIMYAAPSDCESSRESGRHVVFTKMLEMPRMELIQPTGIPNAFWPSDHISILAEVGIGK
jgi:mRNA deadenylase 3'-5' endonuclease subunit Ccr4